MPKMYGSDLRSAALEEYTSPEEYEDQGDTRVVRDLLFTYHVEVQNPVNPGGGDTVVLERTASRNTVVNVDQIGLLALEKGERYHSFYTTDELESLTATGREAPRQLAAGADGEDISSMGPHELAEWLQSESPTINEVLEVVGDDRDMAERMLEAENIATGGDPRAGLEKGLNRIIEESAQ